MEDEQFSNEFLFSLFALNTLSDVKYMYVRICVHIFNN